MCLTIVSDSYNAGWLLDTHHGQFVGVNHLLRSARPRAGKGAENRGVCCFAVKEELRTTLEDMYFID